MIEEREENEAWQITSIRGRSPPSFHVLGFALAPPDTHAGWDLNRVMNAIEFAPLQRGALQELPNPLLHALGPFDIHLEARDLLVEHGGAPGVESPWLEGDGPSHLKNCAVLALPNCCSLTLELHPTRRLERDFRRASFLPLSAAA